MPNQPIRRFLPLVLVVVLCATTPALLATATASAVGTAAKLHGASPTTVLLGDTAMESQRDSLIAGRPRAFRLRAHASGLAAKIRLFIDAQSDARSVLVGIYRNAKRSPGPLLDTGVISTPRNGSWNTLPFVLHQLVSGHSYWLAILAEGGTLRYRSRPGGHCGSATSGRGKLRALPKSWGSRGTLSHARCPISAYALAMVAGVPQGQLVPLGTTFAAGPSSVLAPTPPSGIPPPSEPPSEDEEEPSPPVSLAPPVITGSVSVGSKLTTSTGSWSGDPESYAYQWQECNSAGTGCTNLVGSTFSSHKLVPGDVGDTARVVVTAYNEDGSASATSKATAVITEAPAAPPANTALPVISGTVAVEGTLSASKGAWSGSPTSYVYQWQDCDSSGASCTDIGGASATTHKLTAGEVGHTVRVVVTASSTGGSTPATSAHTSVVPGASDGLFLSPAGNDSNPCTQSQPCLTMDHAYREAEPGQTVQMLAGSYPGQSIDSDSSKTSSSDVVFTPAEGAGVTVTGTIYVFASHVTIENMTVQDVTIGNYDQTNGRPDPTDVTLQDLTGRNFEIDSATNITVEGGSWGPASACGGPNGGSNNSIRQPTSTAPANILIDNTIIHDVQSYDLVECHIEGLAIFAGTNVTVSNSKFYGNSVYDIFMQANSGGHPNNVTLSNNWLATAVDNSGANGDSVGSHNGVAVGDSGINENLTVQGNHMNDVLQMDDNGTKGTYKNVKVSENVGMMPYTNYSCSSLSGIVWTENIWQNDKCSGSDIDLNGAAMPYKKATDDSTLDYTLTGAYADWPEGGGEEEPPAEEEPPVEEPPVEEPPVEEGGAGTPSVFLSPSGSDSAACSQAAPCRTLSRAYSVAQSGATVQLANGTYSDTTLPVDNSKGTSNVVFTAAAGATPTFSSTLHVQAHHVELENLKFATLWVDSSAQNDTFRNDSYKNFEVISSGTQAPTNISFIGGSAGPAADSNNIIGSNGTSTTASPTNIVIRGMHIHDYTLTAGSGAHVDCLQVWAANGLTVEGSTFNDCEVFDIFLQFLPGGSAGTPSNVTIQNNFLDCCRSGYYSIMLPYHSGETGGSHFTNVTIRNNSTDKAITADPDAAYTNVNIDGNIGPSLVFYSNAKDTLQSKPAGVSADYNVWYEGSKVGTHDQKAPSGFVDPSSLNFNLSSGAAAIEHGDPSDYAPTDIYGNSRPNPPDAGATQHTG